MISAIYTTVSFKYPNCDLSLIRQCDILIRMRIPRIFQNQALHVHQSIVLDKEAFQHLHTVLRLSTGAPIILFNGDGHEYLSTLTYHTQSKTLKATVQEKILKNRESPLWTHLGQVISKGHRMEYTLQKSVELGVSQITPLYSAHGEVFLKGEREEKKQEHWQKIIYHACQQCGRNQCPLIHKPISILEWIKNTTEQSKFMLDPKATQTLKNMPLSHSPSIALLIGPEGGLTEHEQQYAQAHGFMGIQLGPRILRTETASVVMLSALQLLAGDLAEEKPS